MPRRPYPFFEALIAPARPSASLPQLFTGSLIVVLGFFTSVYIASILLRALLPADLSERLFAALEDGGTAAGVLGNLFIFIFALLALNVALRQVHGRSLASLLGPTRLATLQFRRVCLYLAGLHLAISVLMPTPPDFVPEPNLDPALWLTLLPLALLALLIQTGTEELVFRGYLQSQLAARFHAPWVWILVPSAAFGVLHHDPAMNGDNTWLIVLWATAFGIAAADLTARAGTLGPAIALHFINNFAAILLAAPEGNFDGLALYSMPFSLEDRGAVWLWAPVDLMVLFCSWLAARLALRR
ncbi:CPBP family intramembrane glutamic endopeptidase [Roseovarius aestuariivivens]|uniref:CPBP family intramembrane glutamic endopeptidase n=1 Tax=Roseovarius aestuariivivens TaxID=1888910 RepID=UPI0010805AA6|nr:CPBP family intramembrane glutamic endopeptidase [Roseovarius aestuariivivens]